MIKAVVSFYQWSSPWRVRFGLFAGLRIAFALRQATWAAPANSLVWVSIPSLPHPVALRAGTSDALVFEQVFRDQQAAFPVPAEPAFIVDAGANTGLTASVFAQRFPRARIIALEINRSNFSILRSNVRHYTNIEAVNNGLWTHRTRVRIENPSDESWSFRCEQADEADVDSVEALGVGDLLAEFGLPRIDVLKIDIEGGELEIFSAGVDEWISQVGMIAVETHDRIRPGCTAAIRRALAPHGFVESTWSEYLVFTRANTVGMTQLGGAAARSPSEG